MAGKFVYRWFYSGLTVSEGTDQRYVDFDSYAKQLAKIYEELDTDGYDVITIVPVSMGQSEPCTQIGGRYVGDVGFSITRGAVVIGKKREG